MKNFSQKISKRDWYARGGFANSMLYRKANKRGAWSYFICWR